MAMTHMRETQMAKSMAYPFMLTKYDISWYFAVDAVVAHQESSMH